MNDGGIVLGPRAVRLDAAPLLTVEQAYAGALRLWGELVDQVHRDLTGDLNTDMTAALNELANGADMTGLLGILSALLIRDAQLHRVDPDTV